MTHPTIITIELRHPSRAMHPNARPHHFTKAKAKKKDRKLAYLVTLAAMNGQRFGWTKAITQATFTVVSTLNDDDNLAAWLKAYWDGIADAGVVVNDRAFKHQPPRVIIGKKTGVSITISKGA